MDSVILIGDTHTVNAFRICGIECFAADAQSSPGIFGKLMKRDDASVILITAECAAPVSDLIRRANMEPGKRVIIEIPGIEEGEGLERSLTSYITEALGVAL